MSAFEFFFSFYGLLLGLSVAELVGGFARVLHEKQRIRFGWLTPMLALFVAIDIATFWNQAWVIFRGAPFNTFVLLISLAIAATFYVAASVTFPRVTAEGVETVEELAVIRRLGCKKIQGYYFGRPMAAAEADTMFTRAQQQYRRADVSRCGLSGRSVHRCGHGIRGFGSADSSGGAD
mgnify:CR=1 FL=1